ncbi:hypothetical protein F5887DRAFT_1156934 [Amanita rubescens]|nr:hypothetical protein F5887DRAFT_1156934 [Amanita rubescens]
MPALRTRDIQSRSNLSHTALEVATDVPQPPTFAIISPTPRAFTFPTAQDSPYSSPSHSPFEPDLRSLPLQCNISQMPRTLSPDQSLRPSSPLSSQAHLHKRRKSSSTDVERRPKKGDEDYIKRPENAFILFRRKCCEDRQQEEGALESPVKKQRQADLSKTISQQWKSLSPEERQYWEHLAKEKKKEHEQMYPNYVYRPQRSKDKPKPKKSLKSRRHENEHETDNESLSFVVPYGSSSTSRSIRICTDTPSIPPGHPDTQCLPHDPIMPGIAVSSSHDQPPTITNRDRGFIGMYTQRKPLVQTNDYLCNLYNIPDQPSLRAAEQPQLHVLTMPQDNFLLPSSLVSPASTIPSTSPSSPDSTPFSPTSALLANFFRPADDAFHLRASTITRGVSIFTQQPDLANFGWESDSLWASSGDTLLTNDDFDLRAIPPIELELPKCSDDVGFNTAPGLVFGQDFTQALEGQQHFENDVRHMNNILMFEEMMAGHGF